MSAFLGGPNLLDWRTERHCDAMELTPYLVDRVREGQVVLFLGAGASKGAISPNNASVPDGAALASKLSDKFLGGQDKDKSLAVIAEYCISESDLQTVQQFIRDLLVPFGPAQLHREIATFRWAAIATTNYDQILELAYESNKDKAQDLVPILRNSDRVDAKLRKEKSVAYLKLHGCISIWSDVTVPMILTIDQYVTHKKNRDKLFERFKHLASEYSVVFVGYRLEDPDLRQILLEISSDTDSKPRSFVVSPSASSRDEKVWEAKHISTLRGTFEEFLSALASKIPSALRSVTPASADHPIQRRFVKHGQTLTPTTADYLEADVVYVRPDMPVNKSEPKMFYKGASFGWAPILAELDCKRHLVDSILSDVVLVEEVDRPSSCDFYVIKGYAGAGKSVLMRRLAWDAASAFKKLCLFHRGDTRLSLEPLVEIAHLCDERIFLFVDRAANLAADLQRVIQSARAKKLRLTVIASERTNEWNVECGSLDSLISESYEMKALSLQEIDWLLEKLEANDSLDNLAGVGYAERVKAFSQVANRQLIVALYEATSGKSFPDIVFDEYKRIQPVQAQQIYLTICALNRLGVPVRAGIVKRVNGVSFETFKRDFFNPLEAIVYTEEYRAAKDMTYRARHPWIAEIVFEQALLSPADRMDLYLRLLDALDVGYQPDRQAFRALIRARDLLRLFPDPLLVRNIYAAASATGAEEAYLNQQMAIYEMRRPNGNLDEAYSALQTARRIAPYDRSILHSLSELEIARAQRFNKGLERTKHFQAAAEIAKELTGSQAESSHGYLTLARVGIESLANYLNAGVDDDIQFSGIIKNIEQTLFAGLEKFPGDEFLLGAQSQLAEMLNEDDKAVSSLEKAQRKNPASPFVAQGLARLYERRSEFQKARVVLEKCLEVLPADKALNATLANLLMKHFPLEGALSEYYWRRSFTEGDANYSSQFWYARQLFVGGKTQEAKAVFHKLKAARVAPDVRNAVKGEIRNSDSSIKVFRGQIDRIEATYAWASVLGESYLVFVHRSKVSPDSWEQLRSGVSIEFNVGFNFSGPAATAISIKH
ncbi:MAG: SIR2 family protein [Burkholderiales bacterium]|nr:SIR2 family protein [Burkholderiales bacterium]